MGRPTAQGLLDRIAEPLILGGSLRPFDAIDPPSARNLAVEAFECLPVVTRITHARVRRARHLCAIDSLPDVSIDEWMMIIGMQNMLRAADPGSAISFSSSRRKRAIEYAMDVLGQAVEPASVGAALARYATFARVFSLRRVDVHLSWWCGSKVFVGRKPTARFLVWPKIRQVESSSRETSALLLGPADSSDSSSPDDPSLYFKVMKTFLALNPLLDLATAGRQLPRFAWTRSNVSILLGPGQNLSMRALRYNEAPGTLAAVLEAKMPPGMDEIARSGLSQMIDVLRAWGEA